MNNEDWISIKSPKGIYDQNTELLTLTPNVEAFLSRGMTLHTKQAFFNFKTSRGYTESPVTGEGPLGKVNSERLEFSGADDTIAFVGKTTIIIKEESLRKD